MRCLDRGVHRQLRSVSARPNRMLSDDHSEMLSSDIARLICSRMDNSTLKKLSLVPRSTRVLNWQRLHYACVSGLVHFSEDELLYYLDAGVIDPSSDECTLFRTACSLGYTKLASRLLADGHVDPSKHVYDSQNPSMLDLLVLGTKTAGYWACIFRMTELALEGALYGIVAILGYRAARM